MSVATLSPNNYLISTWDKLKPDSAPATESCAVHSVPSIPVPLQLLKHWITTRKKSTFATSWFQEHPTASCSSPLQVDQKCGVLQVWMLLEWFGCSEIAAPEAPRAIPCIIKAVHLLHSHFLSSRAVQTQMWHFPVTAALFGDSVEAATLTAVILQKLNLKNTRQQKIPAILSLQLQ